MLGLTEKFVSYYFTKKLEKNKFAHEKKYAKESSLRFAESYMNVFQNKGTQTLQMEIEDILNKSVLKQGFPYYLLSTGISLFA